MWKITPQMWADKFMVVRVTNEWGITTKIATVYTKNELNRNITKCGIDMPSEPNSEIPTVKRHVLVEFCGFFDHF